MDIKRLPTDFLNNMRDMLGVEYDAYLEHMEKAKPRRGLRVNTLKVDRDTFKDIFPYELVNSDFASTGFYLPNDGSYGIHPYHHAGLYYMQEPSAMSVVSAIEPYIGERVLDLCSAPGGKGTYLASIMDGKGTLVLNEYVYSRASILRSNVERMGIRNATIINNDPRDIARLLPCYFDTIVVDAPCSGEGMFLKEEQAVLNWNMKNVETSHTRQLEILSSAYECLAGGGYMVYSTCTLNKIEDEGVVGEFLDRYKDMEIVRVGDALRNATSSGYDDMTEARRIFPHKSIGEGHFFCLMRKTSETSTKVKFDNTYTMVKDDKEFSKLYSNFSSKPYFGRLAEYGDNGYLLPEVVPYKKGINIIRSGVWAYQIEKRRLEPAHNLVTSLKSEDVANKVDFACDSDEIISYLKGNTINANTSFRGYGVLTVYSYPLSIIKSIDGTIKNHYPKGLRNIK